MKITICWKCKNEITEEEGEKGNYREISTLPGEYRHLHCPGVETDKKQISEMKQALARNDSESKADPKSWIARHE